MLIRNHSNLGPLATPDEIENADALGDRAKLEIVCAKSWLQLLDKGAKAHCMICLNESWLMGSLERHGLSFIFRLETLRDNIRCYRDSVKVVDVGAPTNTNLDIYGDIVCLESKKSGFPPKPYQRIYVTHDRHQIKERIADFDTAFEDISRHMLAQAQRELGKEDVTVNEYLLGKLEYLISKMRG